MSLPVAVPGECPWRERLRPSPTAAHAAPSLYLPQAALGLAALPVYICEANATCPFAVPGECPWRERLRPSPTAAHAAPSLYLPQAALGLAALLPALRTFSPLTGKSTLYTREPFCACHIPRNDGERVAEGVDPYIIYMYIAWHWGNGRYWKEKWLQVITKEVNKGCKFSEVVVEFIRIVVDDYSMNGNWR